MITLDIKYNINFMNKITNTNNKNILTVVLYLFKKKKNTILSMKLL